MKIHKDDKVKIITGKDKGKEGKVIKVMPMVNKIIVEGVNKVKRHVKPGTVSKEGGIISVERSIDASNVLLLDPKSHKPVHLGYKIVDGKKYRIAKETGDIISYGK